MPEKLLKIWWWHVLLSQYTHVCVLAAGSMTVVLIRTIVSIVVLSGVSGRVVCASSERLSALVTNVEVASLNETYKNSEKVFLRRNTSEIQKRRSMDENRTGKARTITTSISLTARTPPTAYIRGGYQRRIKLRCDQRNNSNQENCSCWTHMKVLVCVHARQG